MAETKPELRITFAQLYLIVYNFIQCMGWTCIMLAMGFHWIGKDTHIGMYDQTYVLLNIFQTLAILEVVHAVMGIVKTNWILTGFQVASRVFLTWHTFFIPEVHNSIGVSMFLLAWGITEIIRYSFYMCAQVNHIPYILSWCRYTFFYVLYPMGVTGELTTLYSSLPHLWNSTFMTLTLPNVLNFGFSYYYFIIVVMVVGYLPIFPQLYLHMIAQRKKVIGGGSKKRD